MLLGRLDKGEAYPVIPPSGGAASIRASRESREPLGHKEGKQEIPYTRAEWPRTSFGIASWH